MYIIFKNYIENIENKGYHIYIDNKKFNFNSYYLRGGVICIKFKNKDRRINI